MIFLLTLFLLGLFFVYLLPRILQWLLKRGMRNMQPNNNDSAPMASPSRKKKIHPEEGEYVDFEEIDK